MPKYVIVGWMSKAMWPDNEEVNPSLKKNITITRHCDETGARYSARSLDRMGWDGNEKVFPIATWIEPIIEEVK